MDPWRWVDPRAEVRLAGVRASGPARLRRKGQGAVAPLRVGGGPAFVLPASELDADFARSLVEMLTTLSEAEDRHPVALLDEILAAQARRPGLRLLWVRTTPRSPWPGGSSCRRTT